MAKVLEPISDEELKRITVANLRNEYKKLAEEEKNVIFGGRLGQYKYYDMHKVIEEALNCFDSEAKQEVELENILKLDQKVREYVSKKYN